MNDLKRSVSVVIPTLLRPELSRAISSVRQQRDVDVEIIVVADTTRATAEAASNLTAGADVVLHTGGGRRGGYARNAGTRAAEGNYLAYLDDDDWWEPTKLTKQLARLSADSSRNPLVVGTRVRQYDAVTMRGGQASPGTLIATDETLEDYLFLKRPPTAARPSFFTSTIFGKRETLTMARWQEHLPRHQDWDYLLRLQAAGVRFAQIPESLTNYAAGTMGSVSATVDWESSLNWARQWRHSWNKMTYVDFLVAQPLRYAIQSRSRSGVKAVMSELSLQKRIPHASPSLFALGAALPRSYVLQILLKQRKSLKGRIS